MIVLDLFQEPAPPLLDVRTHEEYAEGHIPGAVSFPVLDRDAHAQVSIIYYRDGLDAARDHALALAAPRLRELAATCLRLGANADRPVIYCWRGGMRSQSTAQILAEIGFRVARLDGGYRAHRRYVLAFLERNLPPMIVLHGYTGSGKTRLLRALATGRRVLDLEALAHHRGSTLGHVGLPPQPCQRVFEARIVHALHAPVPPLGPRRPATRGDLRALDQEPAPAPPAAPPPGAMPVLVEAESPTIGKLYLPASLIGAMRNGMHVFLDVPFEERVRLLTEEYAPALRAGADLTESWRYLARRLSAQRLAQLERLVAGGEYAEFTRQILRQHYDPLYERWRAKRAGSSFAAVIKVARFDDALEALADALSRIAADRTPPAHR